MGGQYGYQAPEAESSILQAYSNYLPGLLQEMNQSIPGTAVSEAQATQASQPILDATNLREMQNYALPETDIGNQITNSIANAGARTNAQVLEGAGGEAATAAQKLNESLNPNYYQPTSAASKAATNLVNSISLNGLSPGEENAVERSTNQSNAGTGNLGLFNPTNVVSNAMNFGGAFNNKLGVMENAIGTATGAAGNAASNGGFNPINVALSQPGSQANFGTSAFQPVNSGTSSGASSNTFGFGNSLLGNMQSFNNASESAAPSMAATNSVHSYIPNISC